MFGVGVLECEADKCRILFYNIHTSTENEEQCCKHGKQKIVAMVIIQKYVCKWLVMRPYLKSLSAAISIQCYWGQVLVRREFQRFKQHAYETTIIPIKDSMTNLLEERGNDMVQPWISHKGLFILCLGLMGRPFDQYCVFPWNLACVLFGHDGFLICDSYSQPWLICT